LGGPESPSGRRPCPVHENAAGDWAVAKRPSHLRLTRSFWYGHAGRRTIGPPTYCRSPTPGDLSAGTRKEVQRGRPQGHQPEAVRADLVATVEAALS
jgi:hypothetical protein